ncbi:MAG: DUF2170 family protein [Gammaproteobacteria bacterium]
MNWDLNSLKDLFDRQPSYAVSLEHDCLLITNEEEIVAYLTVSGEQMIVESLLFAAGSVDDRNGLNDRILRTHKFFPLTTIGIVNVDGEDYYAAFGALSSQSKEEVVRIEVDFLFQNVKGMLDAFEGYLK